MLLLDKQFGVVDTPTATRIKRLGPCYYSFITHNQKQTLEVASDLITLRQD